MLIDERNNQWFECVIVHTNPIVKQSSFVCKSFEVVKCSIEFMIAVTDRWIQFGSHVIVNETVLFVTTVQPALTPQLRQLLDIVTVFVQQGSLTDDVKKARKRKADSTKTIGELLLTWLSWLTVNERFTQITKWQSQTTVIESTRKWRRRRRWSRRWRRWTGCKQSLDWFSKRTRLATILVYIQPTFNTDGAAVHVIPYQPAHTANLKETKPCIAFVNASHSHSRCSVCRLHHALRS